MASTFISPKQAFPRLCQVRASLKWQIYLPSAPCYHVCHTIQPLVSLLSSWIMYQMSMAVIHCSTLYLNDWQMQANILFHWGKKKNNWHSSFENKETIESIKSKTYSSWLISSFGPSMNPQLEMNFLFWPPSKMYLPPLMSLSL